MRDVIGMLFLIIGAVAVTQHFALGIPFFIIAALCGFIFLWAKTLGQFWGNSSPVITRYYPNMNFSGEWK